jgi:hypothetical protein
MLIGASIAQFATVIMIGRPRPEAGPGTFGLPGTGHGPGVSGM